MLLTLVAALSLAATPASTDLQQRRTKPADSQRARTPKGGAQPGGFGLGVLLGPAFSLGDGPVWFKGGARFSYELDHLHPAFQLALTLPIVISGARSEGAISDITSTGVELLPGARLLYPLVPRLRVYADLGLGAVLYNFSVRVFGGGGGGGNNGLTFQGRTAGFALRAGLGLEFALLEKLSLNLEPMNLLLGFNDSVVYEVSGNTVRGQDPMPFHWGISVGATYRL